MFKMASSKVVAQLIVVVAIIVSYCYGHAELGLRTTGL